MNGMNRSRVTALATVTVLATLLATSGCGFRDRAGGTAGEVTTVLTFAQAIDGAPPDQLAAWAAQVSRQSHGSLSIKFENGYGPGQADVEAAEIRDVRAGKVDMGWVGARALHQEGVTSFDALIAPMLVDNHDLQERVFEHGIPQDMLAAADVGHGATAIAVLPGPMRKLLGISHPFVKPADFRGTDVGMQDSAVAKATFAALGATSTPLPSGAHDLTHVDAYEQQLSSIWGNQYESVARYLTANVDLWPRPLVVLVNDDTYDGLSADQQAALRQAGPVSVGAAMDASRAEDAGSVDDLCGSGLKIVDATAADLTALQTAVAPVYRQLRTDPKTATWIDRITALKRQVDAPPDTFHCSAGSDRASGASLEGTWTTTITAADGKPGDPRGTFNMTLKDGHLQLTDPSGEVGFYGDYTTFRDRLQVTGGPDVIRADFQVDGGTLTFTDLSGPGCGDCRPYAIVWESHPWTLVDGPARSGLEGTWTTVITAADGIPPENPLGTYTMVLENGRMQLVDPAGRVGWDAPYTAFRHRLNVTGGPDELRADYEVDGDRLTLTNVSMPTCPDCARDLVLWEVHLWHRR
jgi:TRAP-type C4-dicarboxylate transport system substrate-binding protein